ncbi:MAG: NAD(P)(+) transhydrogenase (Re/Si-specific) subunit beta [Planctomycetota bacterium]|nr:NAD(P)(+) transhydrogenase (Re/Si-specific) subunit beta [Planctomycetota bacterium]
MEHLKYLYLAATILFIFGIKGLTNFRTARRGNSMAAIGMLLAIVTVLVETGTVHWYAALGGMAAGATIGYLLAVRVQLTQMPELVAAFNGLGGAASMFVAMAYLVPKAGDLSKLEAAAAVNLPLTILIGTATLSGSLAAYLKLSGKKLVHPIPGAARHLVNAILLLAVAALSFWLFLWAPDADSRILAMVLIAAAAAILGVSLVLPIGGADMPVVVALLNSYSGIAAAASGFIINNQLLIVAGALVGASGLILTRIMCKAMNRSLGNVLLGGIGDDAMAEDARDYENITQTSAEEVAMLCDGASSVIMVPGYGLAVAQAQHTMRSFGNELEQRGVNVRYAIHPVAGRMPGHMNVLLAEADVPYDRLWEMEKINGDFQSCDVAIVVGANDVVNPAAREDPTSPIAGMPILDVDFARTVVVVKRSLSPGYAGIKNPLFECDNCLMFFADAKEALQDMVTEVKEL